MIRLRFAIAAVAACLIAAPAVAQQQAPIYKDRNGNFQGAQGVIVLNPDGSATNGTGAAAQRIQGDTANGTTDVGNPVKIGGNASSAAPSAVISGQRTNGWFGLNGQQATMLVTDTGTKLGGTPNGLYVDLSQTVTLNSPTADAAAAPLAGLAVRSYGQVFNGSTWDRQRGDTNGSYVIPKGTTNLATGQASVGTSATLIAVARSGRSRLIVTQSAAGPCYYGNSNAVSATTGSRLTVAGASKTYQYAGALYGICPGGAVTVDVDEEY